MALILDGTTGISATGNITGGNVIASGSLVVGSFIPASVSASGNIAGGNILTSGLISATGNITGAYLFGNASTVTGLSASKIFNGTSEANIGTSGGNANISIAGTSNVFVVASTGTFVTGTESVTGNIQGGNIRTAGLISATGSVTAGSDLSLIGNIVDTGPLTIITSSNGNITLAPNGSGIVATPSSISAAGNVTCGNILGGNLLVGTGVVACGSIFNNNANGVGNIGTSSSYFNTVFAKATSAQYADLAEMYQADADYAPGTLLDFGGHNEVTITTQSHSTQVAGIVSTNPSYLMNSTLAGTNAVQVALVGRVPCQVVGTIAKGDRLVSSSVPGIATRLDMQHYQPGCIIGKALEAYDSETIGTIEVAVGRF